MCSKLDRRHGRSEDLRSLGHGQTFLLYQFERSALRVWQARQDNLDSYRELARAHELVRGGGIGHSRVGVAVLRENDATAATDVVDQEAAGDRERPGHDLGARDEPIARAVDVQHGLLQEILGASSVASLSKEIAVEAGRERVVNSDERRAVSRCILLHCEIGVRARLHEGVCTTQRFAEDAVDLAP
jgi:hypothetical protein